MSETSPVQAQRMRSEPALCAVSDCTEEASHGRYCSSRCRARDWRETRERLGLPAKALPGDLTALETQTRLKGQKLRILGRLQAGRATNAELSRIALNYTARISDLRDLDHDIRELRELRSGGLRVYALFVGGEEV